MNNCIFHISNTYVYILCTTNVIIRAKKQIFLMKDCVFNSNNDLFIRTK